MKFFAVLLILTGAISWGMFSPTKGEARTGIITITALVKTRQTDGHVISVKILRDKYDTVIGWGNTVCTLLGNGSAQCVGTFNLPRGKISVAGTRRSQNYFVFSIVGGTRLYSGVGGSLIGHTARDGHAHEHLIFSLVFPN